MHINIISCSTQATSCNKFTLFIQNFSLYSHCPFFCLECSDPQPLGAENGNISDSQFDVSGINTIMSGPQAIRLNMAGGGQ